MAGFSAWKNNFERNVMKGQLSAPCRVLREIGEKDRRRYFRNQEIDEDLLQ